MKQDRNSDTSDLDVGRLSHGEAGGRGDLVVDQKLGDHLVDQKLGCGFGCRWVILFSGWFSFALFSATLYTSGKFRSNCRQIYFTFDQYDVHCACAGLFFVIYLQEFGEARSKTAWVSFSFFKQILTGGVFEMQVGSLCSSVYLMYGPIVAAALTKFGRFSVSETFPNRFNHFVQAVGLS